MRLNRDQIIGRFANVFLNDKQIDAFEASEEDGYVLAEYKNVEGHRVLEADAEKGALILDGLQVMRLTGDVRIEIDPGTFTPLQTTVKQ